MVDNGDPKIVAEHRFLAKLIDTTSIPVIRYYVDKALELEPDGTPAYREVLTKIQASDDLNSVWLLCHEYLGQKEEADQIRMWLARTSKKNQNTVV